MLRILPLLVALALGACSRTPAEAQTDQAGSTAAAADAAAQPEPAKPVPTELPGVLARVNGEDVSRTEFEAAVRAMEGRAGATVPPEERDRVYRGVLDQIIGRKLLIQESKTRGVAVPDTELDAYIGQLRGQFPSEEVFQQALAQQQLTLEQLRSEAREGMAIAKMVDDEIAAKVAVDDAQLTAFYRDNPDQFQQRARVRASHILLTVAAGADAATKTQARERAAGIVRDLQGGGDFAALARQHSQDPGSASQGGDLGYFEEGEMPGPFNDAAFQLDSGATSDVVETSFGFHIIRVTDKQAARTIPLDEVRPELEAFLEERNRQQQTEAFVDALKARGMVEILI